MKKSKLAALVALNAVPGLGPVRLPELVARAGDPRNLMQGGSLFKGYADGWDLAQEQFKLLNNLGGKVLAPDMTEWPPSLNNLAQPPPILFVQGDFRLLDDGVKRVCIIGARACTPYGRAQAARFASGIASAGGIVVSGGARGIDQSAMRAALDAGGKVIAVVGSGLDCPYPPEAASLYHNIVSQGGAVISEFACGTAPRRGNFPRRNRLMAALSPVILVVQAALKSGTFTTLKYVEELGNTVCAIPGPVDCAVSQGPNYLIADGAKLVQNPNEVIEEFSTWTMPEDDPNAHPVLLCLANGDKKVEQISAETGEAIEAVLFELADLEIQGRLIRMPGGIYHRCL